MKSFIFELLCCVALFAPYACHRHHPSDACDPADSAAICTQVKRCFALGNNPAACREAEQDAVQLVKPNPGAVEDDAGNALSY